MKNKFILLLRVIICSLGLMVFSYFIHNEFPLRLISFAGLLTAAYFIGSSLKSVSDLKMITGNSPGVRSGTLFFVIGISGGLTLAVLYRWYLDISLLPQTFHYFAIVAAFIGCMEELIFRGFIQGQASVINGPFSILFGTISHTGYKCCLFLSPVIASQVDIRYLAFWTLLAGIIFGTIKHFSKSIIPPLVAHALFDIIVYAEFVSAPWWVW